MKASQLLAVLTGVIKEHGEDVEIRIGDQIMAGPYSHDRVGGVWWHVPGDGNDSLVGDDKKAWGPYVILCAEDTDWQDISISPQALPALWTPSNSDDAREVNKRT